MCDGIPDFLRLTAEERDAAWRESPPKRLNKKERRLDYSRPKTWDSTCEKLSKEIAAEQKRKAAERFALLRARKERS